MTQSRAYQSSSLQVLGLTEYHPRSVSNSEVAEPADLAEFVHSHHRAKFEIRAPSFDHLDAWKFTSRGWIGYIPVNERLALSLESRVPIANVLRMLEWNWDTQIEFPDGLADLDSMRDVYERFAVVLAEHVLRRVRRGLAREYVQKRALLGTVRGRLDASQFTRAPTRVTLDCHFEEHTANTQDNQLVLWTLWRILRSGLCTARSSSKVRRAYHALRSAADLQPFHGTDCTGRLYTRLTEDYRPMHALCRFFLESLGPRHSTGSQQAVPFLLPMPSLFEGFVAKWLSHHLTSPLKAEAQCRLRLHADPQIHFDIDVVIRDAQGKVRTVLDTKYKDTDTPSTADIQQIVAYATATGCTDAVLLYPRPPAQPIDFMVQDVRVRVLGFDLGVSDLDTAGGDLLGQLV